MKIKVFPDHMSTGLWAFQSGASVDQSEVDHVLTTVDFTALKYWHETWEFFISEDKASDTYQQRWSEDGRQLVDSWNSKQSQVEFIYVP